MDLLCGKLGGFIGQFFKNNGMILGSMEELQSTITPIVKGVPHLTDFVLTELITAT